MNLICWNYQGFGNSRTICELHLLVKEKVPGVVFLIETKYNRNKVEGIHDRLGFDHSFVVDNVSRSGGLAAL